MSLTPFSTLNYAHPRFVARKAKPATAVPPVFSGIRKAKQASADEFGPFLAEQTTKARSLKPYAIGALIGALIGWGPTLSELPNFPWTAPGPVTSNVGWPDNVTVFASGSQSDVTFARADSPLHSLPFYEDLGRSFYSEALFDKLAEPGISGLPEAQAALSRDGYPTAFGLTQQSLSTPERHGGWQKDDKTTQRYVLIVADEDFDENAAFVADSLKQNFDLKGENVKVVNNASWMDWFNGMEWLQERMASSQGQPTEVLVYHSAHGLATRQDTGAEGDAEGYIGLGKAGVHEREFKDLLNGGKYEEIFPKWPKDVPTLLVFDDCYSGAWIG